MTPQLISALIKMLYDVARWRRSQAAADPTNLKAMMAATALGTYARDIPRDVSTALLQRVADVLAKPGGWVKAYAAMVAAVAVGADFAQIDATGFLEGLLEGRSTNAAA